MTAEENREKKNWQRSRSRPSEKPSPVLLKENGVQEVPIVG